MEKNLPFHRRFGFALNGIRSAFKSEASFRFQTLATVLVIISLIVLKASAAWWALILMTVGSVLAAELLNTSLEHVLDRLHPEKHPSIMVAKDCAAGAVLVLSIISVAVFLAFLSATFLSVP